MDSPTIPPRPPTPQVLLHRLPDKGDAELSRKPSKYVILIMGSTAVAGKVAIAKSVASALSCPLFQGDSLHQSSAKAASVSSSGAPNETRYQRMWLSKMTRTGLLFPDESRPATEGFTGFGGTSSTSTSRRGSAGSIASVGSSTAHNTGSSTTNTTESTPPSSPYRAHPPALPATTTFPTEGPRGALNTVFTISEEEKKRRANPALMVLTHPELEPWHKLAIRTAVGEYGIGVIFVPLHAEDEDEEEELPILRPLDPTTMTSFPVSFGNVDAVKATTERGWGTLDREMKIQIDVDADVEGKTAEIIALVTDVMGVDI